ncbi:MAG TPA: 3-phosphoshikimate 1-carboxyvinyltransferase [Bacteroidales bacterium]|nr:3-phosphoshikimate 1-carboxyvinyltransferase [Bacteroidales bacterium]
MERSVEPSYVKGHIKAPPSKSMSQRAIAAALLADGQTTITGPSYCDDSLAAMGIADALGAIVERDGDSLKITGGGELKETTLNCGESGLAIRMFSPIAALNPAEITMSGTGSLKTRPMFMIKEALDQLGVKCVTNDGFLPLIIQGPVKGGNCEIDGSMSSQLLTGLLMALPGAENNSEIRVSNLKSKPYIDMTIQVLQEFGISVSNDNYSLFRIAGKQKYKPRLYEVEGDWSGGAFLLVAGAVNGQLRISGLRTDSYQSDKSIMTALEKAGVNPGVGNGFIEVSKSHLKAFEFDATESPDLFPPLVALAAYCNGKTTLKGVSRLIYKESNRATALVEEFGKMGINIEVRDDYMTITGGRIKGARVSSHGDHRIAMAAAVAALGAEDKIIIEDSDCVAKSYPGFFDDLRKTGVTIQD